MPVSARMSKLIEAAKRALARKKAQLVRPPNPVPPASEMLTPLEIEQLRQEQNARLALLQKEFPKAKIHR